MAGTIEIPMREMEFKLGARLFWGKQGAMRVLEVNRKEGTALLIADRPVCKRAYHEKWEDVTWETCSLRAWLNGEYYETTFTEAEKAAIAECTLKNPDNPEYHTPGGKDTTDKIFLLSIDEAEKYFKDREDRATGTSWWLRSPGNDGRRAARVRGTGGIYDDGDDVRSRNGVRPAFQIDLTSDIFRSFIVSESSESILIRNPQMQISEGKVICAPADLEKAEIPEGVTSIWKEAFHGCSSLTRVAIPDSVTIIEKRAFYDTGKIEFRCSEKVFNLLHQDDFDIQNGVLTKYNGPGGDVVIPEGVTSIGEEAFRGCSALKSLSLPQSLKHIADYAFSTSLSDSSWSLRELRLPQGCVLDKDTFDYSVKRILRLNADFFAVPEKLPAYYAEFFTMADPEPYAVAMCRLYQTGKTWQKPLEDAIAAVNQDALVSAFVEILAERKEETAAAALVTFTLDYLDRLSFDQMQKLYPALKQNGFKALKKLVLNEDFQAKWQENIAEKGEEKAEPRSPVEQLVKDNWKVTAQTKKLKKIITEGIKFRDSDEVSSPEAVIFVINEYASQLELPTYLSMYASSYVSCTFSEPADKIAAALEPEPLQALLEEIAYKEEYNKDGFLLALGRYGSGKQISRLVAQMKDWETWYKYAATGRRNIIIARGALMMSDTREAMLALDKSGHLGTYAAMRGEDADTLRDTVLSEFGFDAGGKKIYSLGANSLQVTLDRDLKLVLFDCGAGKTVKSVPKKNADPTLYETAKADIAELRMNIKRVVKSRSQKLFNAFLTGQGQNAEAWKTSYLANPVLRAVAELLVWQQGDKTFTVSADGPTDSLGKPYSLSEEDIRVAYPSEMNQEDLARWQELFLAEKRKQPFEQIWEPVIDPATVKPDRYKGCQLNIYKFSNKEQHGIGTYGMGDYSEDFGFSLTDCELEAECSEWRFVHGMSDNAVYTLGDFRIVKASRVSNHIVGLLDRWTVSERVLKDEQDLGSALNAFTLAQIMELIELASQHSCPNSLAILMDYKNARFPEADPLAEFTLE